jgi:hypothetical protein
MPTIAEAAQQLAADGLPVLFIDTCILLDVIRAPLRKIPGCIQSAVELAEMQAQSGCRIVVSSMIQNEWRVHEQIVVKELDRHLELRDQDARAFHEACEHLNVSLSFGKASYQAAGLGAKLRDLSADLLKNAMHLLPSDETKAKATNRTLACIRPARKGIGLQDCIIIEEYLEVCSQLQATGFAKARVFCSSNTEDYQYGRKLHESLATEFGTVGLVFTNALHWAVNELKKASK